MGPCDERRASEEKMRSHSLTLNRFIFARCCFRSLAPIESLEQANDPIASGDFINSIEQLKGGEH